MRPQARGAGDGSPCTTTSSPGASPAPRRAGDGLATGGGLPVSPGRLDRRLRGRPPLPEEDDGRQDAEVDGESSADPHRRGGYARATGLHRGDEPAPKALSRWPDRSLAVEDPGSPGARRGVRHAREEGPAPPGEEEEFGDLWAVGGPSGKKCVGEELREIGIVMGRQGRDSGRAPSSPETRGCPKGSPLGRAQAPVLEARLPGGAPRPTSPSESSDRSRHPQLGAGRGLSARPGRGAARTRLAGQRNGASFRSPPGPEGMARGLPQDPWWGSRRGPSALRRRR
jgi:hypothetical protein